MKKEFLTTFNTVLKKIKENSIILDVEFIALLGSVREKEAILNYSDIDILLILKSNKNGKIKTNSINKLKKIVNESSINSNTKISILTHTRHDLENYVDVVYLINYSRGEVFYSSGFANNQYKKLLKNIILNKLSSKENNIKNLIYYNLCHARFNIIREYVSLNSTNTTGYEKAFLKKIIDKMLEVSNWCLEYENVWVEKKIEIINVTSKIFGNEINTSILNTAYEIRKNWNIRELDEVDVFLRKSINYINDLSTIIIKKHENTIHI